MNYQIRRFSIHQTSKVFAVIYGSLSIVFVPFMILAALFGQGAAGTLSLLVWLIVPFLYAGIGYVATALACWTYNFLVKFTGGIEFALERAPEAKIEAQVASGSSSSQTA